MEHNEVRDSLNEVPTFTLPPPPRFDAAASAAARPVEPLPRSRGLRNLRLDSKFFKINRRSKLLALMAIVGLATGAAGGMLVVQRDKQQRLIDSSSVIQVPGEQTGTPETVGSPTQDNSANLGLVEPTENPVRGRRNQRRPRKELTSESVVLSNADEDLDRNKDDEDRDKNDDGRKKDRDRERSRKYREHDADSHRSDRTRQGGAVLYDVLRTRRP